MDVNYRSTLITVADDCPVEASTIPILRGGKKTIPVIQYELLKDHPYKYTGLNVDANLRVSSDKAKKELGIAFRPFAETIRDEVDWYKDVAR